MVSTQTSFLQSSILSFITAWSTTTFSPGPASQSTRSLLPVICGNGCLCPSSHLPAEWRTGTMVLLHQEHEAVGLGPVRYVGSSNSSDLGNTLRFSQFTSMHSLLIYFSKFDSLKCLTPTVYPPRFLCTGTVWLLLQNNIFIKCCNSLVKIVAQK